LKSFEEIEVVANGLNETGAEAFRSGDYERARQAIEEATRLAEFRRKIKSLQKEWADLTAHQVRGRRKPTRPKRTERLPSGLRTPEDAFRRPILEALVELGGSAPIGEVLDRVEDKMRNLLNQYDYKFLPSGPKSVRCFSACMLISAASLTGSAYRCAGIR
jgi:hypothetical protein